MRPLFCPLLTKVGERRLPGPQCDVSQAERLLPRPRPHRGPAGRGVPSPLATVTLLVGTERSLLKMVRMSCLLGSPIVTENRGKAVLNNREEKRLPPPGDRGAGLRVTKGTAPAAPRLRPQAGARAFSFTPDVQRRRWFLRVPTSKSGAAGACADAQPTPCLLHLSAVLPQISALVGVLQGPPRLCAGSTGLIHWSHGQSHTYPSAWQSQWVPSS